MEHVLEVASNEVALPDQETYLCYCQEEINKVLAFLAHGKSAKIGIRSSIVSCSGL
jgi:hypothetical protein